MARREVQPRQFTIYFNSREDLERYKKLAEPYTLNRWIMLTIEKAVEKPIRTERSDEINTLRKENHELKQENEALTARLEKTLAREVDAIIERAKGPMQLDKGVVDLLRTGGVWSSARIIKEMAVADGEDGYRATEIEENPVFYLEKELSKPVNRSERVRGIKQTLEQLEALNLVKYTGQGWKWNK
jgi:hypothetical protein